MLIKNPSSGVSFKLPTLIIDEEEEEEEGEVGEENQEDEEKEGGLEGLLKPKWPTGAPRANPSTKARKKATWRSKFISDL